MTVPVSFSPGLQEKIKKRYKAKAQDEYHLLEDKVREVIISQKANPYFCPWPVATAEEEKCSVEVSFMEYDGYWIVVLPMFLKNRGEKTWAIMLKDEFRGQRRLQDGQQRL